MVSPDWPYPSSARPDQLARRILLFPFGNNVDQSSVYLEHSFEDPSAISDDWSCCVQFSLVMWNVNDPSLLTHHTAHHRFTREESDWGFMRFLELSKMFQVPWEGSTRPLVENETVNITAYVRIVEDETGVLWHSMNNYDSKKETGYVGLKNQGATCYLNSLLQSLFFTNAFRKVRLSHPRSRSPFPFSLFSPLFFPLFFFVFGGKAGLRSEEAGLTPCRLCIKYPQPRTRA